VIALRFQHGGNYFSNGFFVVNDKYVFHVHGWLAPGVIIRDGTPEFGVVAQ